MNGSRTPPPKFLREIGHILAAIALFLIPVLLGTRLVCNFLDCQSWVYWIATGLTIVSVLLRIGSAHLWKAERLARGRAPMRPTSTGYDLASFAHELKTVFKPTEIPMRDEEDRGWQISFSDGSETVSINVYKMELYRWLLKAYRRQSFLLGKQSAISRRSNQRLDLLQWKARIELLKKANAVYRNSNSSNSTIYLKQYDDKQDIEAAWYIVDELLEGWEPSKKLW